MVFNEFLLSPSDVSISETYLSLTNLSCPRTTKTTSCASRSSPGRRARRRSACPPSAHLATKSSSSPTTGRPVRPRTKWTRRVPRPIPMGHAAPRADPRASSLCALWPWPLRLLPHVPFTLLKSLYYPSSATGLVPLIMTSHYRRYNCFRNARSLFVVHNMGYHGVYPNPPTWSQPKFSLQVPPAQPSWGRRPAVRAPAVARRARFLSAERPGPLCAQDMGLRDNSYYDKYMWTFPIHERPSKGRDPRDDGEAIKLLRGGIEMADRSAPPRPRGHTVTLSRARRRAVTRRAYDAARSCVTHRAGSRKLGWSRWRHRTKTRSRASRAASGCMTPRARAPTTSTASSTAHTRSLPRRA